MASKVCVICGSNIVQGHARQVTCSEVCRKARKRATRAASMRAAYARNPERTNAHSKAWRERNKEQYLKDRKERYQKNREAALAYAKEYREKKKGGNQ